MLYQGEVTYSKGHLTVHNPYNTCIHCCPKNLPPNSFPPAIEGLGVQCLYAEEEDYDGTVYPIEHPAEYSTPVEKNILHSFLVQ